MFLSRSVIDCSVYLLLGCWEQVLCKELRELFGGKNHITYWIFRVRVVGDVLCYRREYFSFVHRCVLRGLVVFLFRAMSAGIVSTEASVYALAHLFAANLTIRKSHKVIVSPLGCRFLGYPQVIYNGVFARHTRSL